MSKLDPAKLRPDFPILQRLVRGKPLAYLDNAATTQKPRQVIQALVDFYEKSNANVHRGVHTLSEEATNLAEAVRTKLAAFTGAPHERRDRGIGHQVNHQLAGAEETRVDRCRVGLDSLAIEVADTGPGIPSELQESIFEPFVQGNPSLTRIAEGAGLGLAICRQLARAMGGDVTVHSREGAGSTFVLTLPRRGG